MELQNSVQKSLQQIQQRLKLNQTQFGAKRSTKRKSLCTSMVGTKSKVMVRPTTSKNLIQSSKTPEKKFKEPSQALKRSKSGAKLMGAKNRADHSQSFIENKPIYNDYVEVIND